MGRFRYEGVHLGTTVQGTLRARTVDDAAKILRGRDFLIARLEPVKRRKTFSDAELANFCRGMTSLMGSGAPLADAGVLWARDLKNSGPWLDIFEKVIQGRPLSQAAQPFFPAWLLAMIRIGEASGSMRQSFESSWRYLEDRRRLRRALVSAMTYPAIVLAAATFALAVLLGYVLPIFQDMYRKFDADLPVLTRLLMAVMVFLRDYGLLLALCVAVIVYGLTAVFKNDPQRLWLDRLTYRLPLLGGFIALCHQARFCASLGHLLTSGVGLLEALEIISSIMANRDFRLRINEVRDAVARGETMAKAMGDQSVLSGGNLKIVEMAEQSAALGSAFSDLGETLTEEVNHQTSTFTALFEPILIVVLAVVIGFVLIALYLPMFDIVQIMESSR